MQAGAASTVMTSCPFVADGSNWRACSSVASGGDGLANVIPYSPGLKPALCPGETLDGHNQVPNYCLDDDCTPDQGNKGTREEMEALCEKCGSGLCNALHDTDKRA